MMQDTANDNANLAAMAREKLAGLENGEGARFEIHNVEVVGETCYVSYLSGTEEKKLPDRKKSRLALAALLGALGMEEKQARKTPFSWFTSLIMPSPVDVIRFPAVKIAEFVSGKENK